MMFKETIQHTTKILLGRKDVKERILYYSVYLNVTDVIFRLKKKINLFQKESKYCDQKEFKPACLSGSSFALRQDQILSAQSLKMSSE